MSQRLGGEGPACWLDSEPATVAENLALDEALLDEAHEGRLGRTVVRTWMAVEPTVVLGSSSHVEREIDLDACRAGGVAVLRRPSGGLTVVIGPGCLMWSVVVPVTAAAPSVDRIHAALLDPLSASLTLAGRAVVRRGTSDLAIDVAGSVRKVSGNALRVRRQARPRPAARHGSRCVQSASR